MLTFCPGPINNLHIHFTLEMTPVVKNFKSALGAAELTKNIVNAFDHVAYAIIQSIYLHLLLNKSISDP